MLTFPENISAKNYQNWKSKQDVFKIQCTHIYSGRLPLLAARAVVILATLKRAATNFTAW